MRKLPDLKENIFEPSEFVAVDSKKEVFEAACSSWLHTVNNVRTIIQGQKGLVYIPELCSSAVGK